MGLFSLASAHLVAGCGGGPSGNSGEGRKVVVIGGGLAGLVAAYNLQQEGFEVVLLEGQQRVGGRVYTAREGLQDGQFAEMGAVRIASVHDRTLHWVEEMGLELVEFKDGTPLYYLEGQRFTHGDASEWPIAGLNADEATLGLGDFWSEKIASRFEEFGDPRMGTFPKPGIEEKYGDMTWAEFLRESGASDAYLKIYASDNGTEIEKIGALAWMMSEIADQAWDQTYHIKGGNDLLPKAIADALGEGTIQFGRKVVKIVHSDEGVQVTAEHEGAEEVHEADYLVSAIPFTTLRKVAIEPPLSAQKTKAIRENFLMNSARGVVQTKTRFWEAEDFGGLKLAKTDLAVERVWNLSDVQTGGSGGVITSYVQHENAAALCAVPPAEREKYILDGLAPVFPQLAEEKVAFLHHCWADDPWVEGAWTDFLPGQWWLLAEAGRSEGRIHFAGEHTSVWAGYMQGAIESGERAADEIVLAAGG